MQDSTPSTPASRATEFVPVSGGESTTSEGTMLVMAYLLMWAILLGFVFATWRKQGKLAERIVRLESAAGGKQSG